MTGLKTIAALVLAACLTAFPAEARTLKIATVAPEDSPWFEMLSRMAQEWEGAAGGKVTTRIYPAGIAGDEFTLISKMRVGQIDAAMLSIGSMPDIAWQLRALHMPLLIQDYDELDHVMAEMSPVFERHMLDQGFRVLAWGDAGFVQFFSTEPVIGPDDLKTQRLFAWGSNSQYIDAWRDMGYNPVPLPATDIFVSLETGVIDAIAVPPIAALANQWFGIARNMTDMAWAPMVGAIVISERAWRKVPKGLRAEFEGIARAAARDAQAKTRAVGPQAVAAMKANGLQVHAVPPETLAAWRAAVDKGFTPLVGDIVPADLLARIQKLVAEHRAARGN